jgi:hypothetical protein
MPLRMKNVSFIALSFFALSLSTNALANFEEVGLILATSFDAAGSASTMVTSYLDSGNFAELASKAVDENEKKKLLAGSRYAAKESAYDAVQFAWSAGTLVCARINPRMSKFVYGMVALARVLPSLTSTLAAGLAQNCAKDTPLEVQVDARFFVERVLFAWNWGIIGISLIN